MNFNSNSRTNILLNNSNQTKRFPTLFQASYQLKNRQKTRQQLHFDTRTGMAETLVLKVSRQFLHGNAMDITDSFIQFHDYVK